MTAVDLLIFDLDGTLIDSKLDLACAVNAARGWNRVSPPPDDTVVSASTWATAPRR